MIILFPFRLACQTYNQLAINCVEISVLQKCERTGCLHIVIFGVFVTTLDVSGMVELCNMDRLFG